MTSPHAAGVLSHAITFSNASLASLTCLAVSFAFPDRPPAYLLLSEGHAPYRDTI